jgi:hypothetical protein
MQEGERRAHTRGNVCAGLVGTLVADAQRRQAKARGRDARNRACIVTGSQRAVLDLARCGVGLLPEKPECGALDFIQ